MKTISTFVLALSLAACVSLGKQHTEGSIAFHDFGAPPAPAADTAKAAYLFALEVAGPVSLESSGIAYRLAYLDPSRRYEYAQARWASSPLNLLAQRLTQLPGHLPSGQGSVRCKARVYLTEFSQVFTRAESSQAQVDGHLSLLARDGRSLGEKRVHLILPAPSPDSRGGVAALTQAANVLAAELVEWETKMAERGELASCR